MFDCRSRVVQGLESDPATGFPSGPGMCFGDSTPRRRCRFSDSAVLPTYSNPAQHALHASQLLVPSPDDGMIFYDGGQNAVPASGTMASAVSSDSPHTAPFYVNGVFVECDALRISGHRTSCSVLLRPCGVALIGLSATFNSQARPLRRPSHRRWIPAGLRRIRVRRILLSPDSS